MTFVLNIAAIAVGLLLGGIAGYAIGTTWRDERAKLWAAGIAAFVAASVLNFLGRFMGVEWLSVGAIGLMAGVLSGVKYGGFPDVRIWEQPAVRADESDVDDAGSGDGDASAPAE